MQTRGSHTTADFYVAAVQIWLLSVATKIISFSVGRRRAEPWPQLPFAQGLYRP